MKWLKTGLIAGLSVVALTACTPMTSQLDQHFGRSMQSAKFNQIINVDAGREPQPMTGLTGEAAQSAMIRYHSSFVKEAPTQPTFVLPTTGRN